MNQGQGGGGSFYQGQGGMMRGVVVNGNPVINNLADAARYSVNQNSYEFVTQSLYDSAAYPTTGIAQLIFFQDQVGKGTGVISGTAKTYEDTNMDGSGAMPNLQAYVITSVELDVQPDITFTDVTMPAAFGAEAVATSINDVWIIRATGWLELWIGNKPYLREGPLMKFPASNDLEIDAAVADQSTIAANLQTRIGYAKSVGPSYILAPNNLLLIPLQNFKLLLQWSTLQPITTKARIFARFMGQLIRAAQ